MVKRYCPIGEQTNLVLANCLSTFIDDFLETDVKRLGKKGKAGGGGDEKGWVGSQVPRLEASRTAQTVKHQKRIKKSTAWTTFSGLMYCLAGYKHW